MKLFSLLLLAALATGSLQAQQRKIAAQRLNGAIKIDGNINDAAWKEAPLATDLILMRPNPGAHELPGNHTEMRIVYDNSFVYVAGYCHEKSRDSLTKELVGRDRLGSNDFAGVIFDTYLDKINGSGFFVTPLGEQFDTRYSSNSEDASWNAVWDGESKLVADGWTFELRIPYSALRFNAKQLQNWGINFFRRRNKSGQSLTWNEVSPQVNGFINQFGEWTGIENIQAPVRLSFSPYLSSYINHFPSNDPAVKSTTASVNGGMDIKYGINESFTLDLTAIPDFGQVQSDNQVLNLSPFEVKYNENRSFFTEGTELFNKANNSGDGGGTGMFYSRRIGGQPLHYYDVYGQMNAGEILKKNPSETRLLNAVKVSGRNSQKLGIGVLNAITQKAWATVSDGQGKDRKLETNPLTNYNMIVFDQALKNNSSIGILNTNVWREGSDYDANVLATVFNFNNKKNTYGVNGKVANSRLVGLPGGDQDGYQYSISGGKTGGRLNYNIGQELTDHKFDQNDMGILFNNNYLDHWLWVGYRWLKPGKWYNNLQVNYNAYYSRRFKPGDYQAFNTNINANVQLKNIAYAGFWLQYRAEDNDFYEPRVSDRVFKRPRSAALNFWGGNNEANRYSYNISVFSRFFHGYGGQAYNASLWQRYRFSDKISLEHSINYSFDHGTPGFAGLLNNNPATILFGNRDRTTVENITNIKYNFNNKMGLSTRVRHYWSRVNNTSYYLLAQDGTLNNHTGAVSDQNRNFNFFNIDMVYSWQFAPGSFVNLVWKNSIFTNDQDITATYFKNLGNTLESPQNNSISFRIIYFIDYLNLRKRRSL